MTDNEKLEAENRQLRAELERRDNPDTGPTHDELVALARTNPAEFNRRIDAREVTRFKPKETK